MKPENDSEREVAQADLQDLAHLADRYTLVAKIGEGTFSTVYKAEDLHQAAYQNDWLEHLGGDPTCKYFVAIKRIYVTASPSRIHNELDLLQSLRNSRHVLPIITSFRYEDQVFIVLPYYKHADFRAYFRDLSLLDIRFYMRSLVSALCDVHAEGIIHRDIKPCNFLYDVHKREGQLVDFGLAERMSNAKTVCPCKERSGMSPAERRTIEMVTPTHAKLSRSYLKEDHRPGKRANRAGTRGFRAPEVLFKCENQSTAIDMWSVGVLLLTFLSGRFPFFNSADDIDALVELMSVYGKAAMRQAAQQHNQTLEVSLPTLHERPIPFQRLIRWCQTGTRDNDFEETSEMAEAIEFLSKCLDLDPWSRLTAKEALDHPYLLLIENDIADYAAEKGIVVADDEVVSGLEHSENGEAADADEATPAKTTTAPRQLRSPAKLDEASQGLQQQMDSTDSPTTLSLEQTAVSNQPVVRAGVLPSARLQYVDKVIAGTQRRMDALVQVDASQQKEGRPVLRTLDQAINHGTGSPANQADKTKRGRSSPVQPSVRPTKLTRNASQVDDPFLSKKEVKPFGLFGSFMQDQNDRAATFSATLASEEA